MILDRISEAKDIKKLNIKELNVLKEEIRCYLTETVEQTGGHLASNLGVVELTIALHYVFNSPKDKLIFDVGHQSYVHKMLTGRKDQMCTLRKKGGISGFNKRSESEHDHFGVGHSSTSISAALGFYYSNLLKGENRHVVSIIGDGALTAGIAFEGLNNSGNLDKNFIVILNDNNMSIDANVGAVSLYLDKLRTAHNYQNAKSDISKTLDRIPLIGSPIKRAAKDIKSAVKQVVIPGMIFEEMGYTYLGPIDGHNIKHLITVLRQAKKIDGPVLVHIRTIKGKGHILAEKSPEKYHGIKPVHTANKKHKTYGNILSQKLMEYKQDGNNIVAISAAMPSGTG